MDSNNSMSEDHYPWSTNRDKGRCSWKEEILVKFSDVLQKSRQDLADEAIQVLSKNENELRRRLHNIPDSLMIDSSHSKLKGDVLGSLSAEDRTLASAPVSGGDLERSKDLEQIMKDLQHDYRIHKKGLKELWKDWHEVQEDIACLGVEVLGFSRLDIIQGSKQHARKRNLRENMLCHKSWEEQKAEHDSFIHNEAGKIKDMSRKTIAKSRTQAKASRVEKHKCWKIVGDLARKLVAKTM